MTDNQATLYLLKINDGRWRVVSKQIWISAERAAGFINTLGRDDEPATGGFSSSSDTESVEGTLVNVASFVPAHYDPELRDAVVSAIATASC